MTRVVREALVAIGASVAVAVAMTWPALRHPTRTLPHDLVDPALMGWEARWGAYALLERPSRLFDANAFYPEARSYAFSDTLLGYWPLALLGHGPGGAALATNLIYVFSCVLASIGGYALVRQLGADWIGSAVAGVAVAYAPWRLTQVGHLHVISTGGIMLALAMLARGHGFSIRHGWLGGGGGHGIRHGYRPARGSVGWIVGGWLVAAWQMTIGFGIGLVFAYVLAGIGTCAAILWWRRGRRPLGRGVLLANLAGGLAFVAVTVLMALPYLRVVADHPYARRGTAELAYYSPPPWGFLAGPVESLVWHDDPLGLRGVVPVPTEMSLLPGLVLFVLAGLGLKVSVWPRRWRIGLGIGVLVSIVLGSGTRIPPNGQATYLVLYHLPGFDALRTPGRLVVWTTLLLAVLAAGAITAVGERLRGPLLRRRLSAVTAGRTVGVLAVGLVLVEGISVMPHPTVPAPPAALTAAHAQTVRPPLLVLPSDQRLDTLVMLWSTDGFPEMVNGLSGFIPASQAEIRAGTHSFPDAASVDLLRRYGVNTVVVLRDQIADTPWAGAADAPVDGLGITRQEIAEAVVYSLG